MGKREITHVFEFAFVASEVLSKMYHRDQIGSGKIWKFLQTQNLVLPTVLGRLICNFHFVTLRWYVKLWQF